MYLQQLKGMQSSKQGTRKGYYLSIEVYERDTFFRKNGI